MHWDKNYNAYSANWSEVAYRRVEELFLQLTASCKYEELEPAERAVVDIVGLITEVDNGGMSQFFYNLVGNTAKEVEASLSLIDSKETLAVFRQACALFPNGSPSVELATRRSEIETVNCRDERIFDTLSDVFYERREDLYSLVYMTWSKQL